MIRSLETFLYERRLVHSSSVEVLENLVLGIDLDHYLERILKKDKLTILNEDLKLFKNFNISPLFVILGINSLTLDIKFYLNYFILHNIHYVISPYSSYHQLSYLLNSHIIDIIYGSVDLLLLNISKLIISFDLIEFKFVEKKRILSDLHINLRQFNDLLIVSGTSSQPITFPFLPKNSFKSALDLLYSLGSPLSLSSYIFSLNDPNLFAIYTKSLSKLNFTPIINLQGYTSLYATECAKLGLHIDHEFILQSDDECASDYDSNLKSRNYSNLNSASDSKVKSGNYSNLNSAGDSKVKSAGGAANTESKFESGKSAGAANSESNSKSESGKSAGAASSSSNSEPGKSAISFENHQVVKIPNDVHEIASQRLPAEIYFYQSLGLIPVDLLESITKGQLDIKPDSESSSSDSYKKLITSDYYINILDYNFNLITLLLTRYYTVKKINVKYWFQDKSVQLNNRLTPTVSQRVSKLFLQGIESNEFLLNLFLNRLNGDYTKKELITSVNDTVSTVLLRTLYLFGIIEENGELSKLGNVLKEFVTNNETSNTELEQLVLISLLIQSKSLVLTESNPKLTNTPKYGTETVVETPEENKYINLISRIFSLNKFNISPTKYQGLISRDLLSFRSHINFINKNLNWSIQSLLIDFITTQSNNNIKIQFDERENWYELINQLPFFKDVNNTLLGVISEIYLKHGLKLLKSGEGVEKISGLTKDFILNNVFQVGNQSYNVDSTGSNSVTPEQFLNDFNNGLSFWSKFIKLIKLLNSEKLIEGEYYEDIIKADTWLKQFV